MKEEKIIGTEPEIRVSVVSSSIALVDYCEAPDFFIDERIGKIKEKYFYDEQKNKIKNKNISQLVFINVNYNTVFNYKQVKKLANEIEILYQSNKFDKKTLEVINEGVKLVLKNKNLYLKFQYA